MSTEDYKEAMEALEEGFAQEKKDLYDQHKRDVLDLKITYAFANNPFPVGSVITNGKETIEIAKIGLSELGEFPSCFYVGPVLDENGSETGKRGIIRQNDVIENE